MAGNGVCAQIDTRGSRLVRDIGDRGVPGVDESLVGFRTVTAIIN